jgi:23S rRNA pseudouridine1911/1915/1917 synthase
VGDPVYGRRSPLVGRQFLHAHRLSLLLPSGEVREFISPLPPDLERALAAVRAGAHP